jgi:hypothetical protein
MDATKDLSIGFHAVADHPALAVRANRRERVDCALKAVEGVMLASDDDLKRLVIIIFANFASSHTKTVRASSPLRRYSFFFASKKFVTRAGSQVLWFIGEAVSFPYTYTGSPK